MARLMNVKVSSAERRAASVIHYLGQFLPSAHAASTLLSAPPNWSSVSNGVSGPWIAPNTQTAACSLTDIFLLQHVHLSAPQTVPCSTVTYLLYFFIYIIDSRPFPDTRWFLKLGSIWPFTHMHLYR